MYSPISGLKIDQPSQVLLKGMRLILREHENAAHAGMEAVRQREVDNAVFAAERNPWLGPIGGQRIQPRADAPREQDGQRVFEHA